MSSRPEDVNPEQGEPEPTVIRDKRRIDPNTGEVRQPEADQDASGAASAAPGEAPADASDQSGSAAAHAAAAAAADQSVSDADNTALADAAAKLAEERLVDLQRLQAEYVNYRKRVERDRDVARDQGIQSVLETLLPVLDDIELARQHGDLAGGPFASIAEKLEAGLGRYGLKRYGAIGDEFDPNIHEALLHNESDEVTTTSVTQVLQPGYLAGERVIRPARVGVTSPA